MNHLVFAMRSHFKVALVFVAIMCVLPHSGKAQGNLTVETPTASIPASQYQTPYVENNRGQISRTYQSYGWLGQKERDYQLFVPDDYQDAHQYPAIVLLHGAKRTGVSLVEKWMPLAQKEGIILIGPTHPQQGWPVNESEANLIADIVDDVAEDYNVNRQRLYLFGHSSGGHMAAAMPYMKPNMFAAITVNAGALPFKANYKPGQSIRKTPIAFIAGSDDSVVPAAQTANAAEFYAERGHETLFVAYEGHNHWYYTIAPEINARAWDFLSAHHL